jgi:hypothetical protein
MFMFVAIAGSVTAAVAFWAYVRMRRKRAGASAA